MLSISNYAVYKLVLMSFAVSTVPLRTRPMNQDGGNFPNFKVIRKKEDWTKIKNLLAEVLNFV